MTVASSIDKSHGTQAVERAINLLRMVASRGRVGWGLTELANASGLKKATAHRILGRLERERLVHRLESSDRYFLGPLLGELAMSVPGLQDFVREVQGVVAEFAREVALVTLLTLRSGDHFVVVARVKTPRMRGELHAEGARHPLITTAGGVAILNTLDPATQERIVAANRAELLGLGRSRIDEHLARWERSRRLGYSINQGDVAQGVNAVAVPVFNRSGQAFASLTHAGPTSVLSATRCRELVPAMRHRGVKIAQIAARLHPDLYGCAANQADST